MNGKQVSCWMPTLTDSMKLSQLLWRGGLVTPSSPHGPLVAPATLQENTFLQSCKGLHSCPFLKEETEAQRICMTGKLRMWSRDACFRQWMHKSETSILKVEFDFGRWRWVGKEFLGEVIWPWVFTVSWVAGAVYGRCSNTWPRRLINLGSNSDPHLFELPEPSFSQL